MDSMGIESRWGRDFSHPFIPNLGPSQSPVQWVPGLFLRGKAPERIVESPNPI